MSDLSEISDDESGTQVQNQRKEKGIKRSRELPNFDSEEDDDLQHDGLADSISSTVSVTFFKLSPFSFHFCHDFRLITANTRLTV